MTSTCDHIINALCARVNTEVTKTFPPHGELPLAICPPCESCGRPDDGQTCKDVEDHSSASTRSAQRRTKDAAYTAGLPHSSQGPTTSASSARACTTPQLRQIPCSQKEAFSRVLREIILCFRVERVEEGKKFGDVCEVFAGFAQSEEEDYVTQGAEGEGNREEVNRVHGPGLEGVRQRPRLRCRTQRGQARRFSRRRRGRRGGL